METADILVIGAGIVGCSLARELARVTRSVLVVERGGIGAGASSAAAGLLAPALSASPVGPLADLCFESAALYAAWVAELKADGAGDVGYRCPGLLELYDASKPPAPVEVAAGRGQRVDRLSPAQLRKLEPALRGEQVAAYFFPEAAQVDAAKVTRQVARVAQLAGVAIRQNEPVHRLVRQGDRVTAVHTATSVYHPGLAILTAGAWS